MMYVRLFILLLGDLYKGLVMDSKKMSGRGYALKMIDSMAVGGGRRDVPSAGASSSQNLFKSHKKQSTVDIVINSFRELLLTRKLVPGQKIPSENEICEGLGVSRGSVREAMKILAAFGVVEIRVGDGTYIPLEPKAALIDPLLFSFMIYSPDVQEVMEFRRLVELDVVELIIAHKDRNSAERTLLKENLGELAALQGAKAKLDAFAANDMEFHRLMGRAAYNKLTRRIYDFALDYLEHTINETHKAQDYGSSSYEVHKQILDAIGNNDLDLARHAIDHSVEVWRNFQD